MVGMRPCCAGVLIRWLACARVAQVYSTYASNVETQVLKGHNGSVTDISWSYNDMRMASCSSTGEVFEWRIDAMMKDHGRESVMRGCIYSSVRVPPPLSPL
eukprot:3400956-Pyramimonas_sp.AAC.1